MSSPGIVSVAPSLAKSLARQVTLVCGLALAACGGAPKPAPSASRGKARDGFVQSNITRADYAGSEACEACHHEVYQAWLGSPMHRMTRVPRGAEIRAPFDGRSFRFKDDEVKLSEDRGERFMEISSASFGRHIYRITRVIGGRYREDFAGREVDRAAVSATWRDAGTSELILPVSYVFSPPSFRLKGYSVMVAERPGLKAGGVWNQTCIFCHNVAPYFSSLLGELLGPSAPGYQGEVVDRILPSERRARLVITDEGALVRAARDEISFLSAKRGAGAGELSTSDVPEALAAAIGVTRHSFDASHLVELGVGCESCHGGSREHVANPDIKPSFEIRSSFVRADTGAQGGHPAAPGARHQSRLRALPPSALLALSVHLGRGGRAVTTRGGATSARARPGIFCWEGVRALSRAPACHDPHAADAPDKLPARWNRRGQRTVPRLSRQVPRNASSRPTRITPLPVPGRSASIVTCPKRTWGSGYQLTRYHRIGSPNDKAKVESDRPLECALCHVDKSTLELVNSMEAFWGKRYDQELELLYGDLGRSPLLATATRGKAHEQATAIHVLGEARVAAALPGVAEQLCNPFPLVRYYARQALGQITGRPCDIDLDRDSADIRAETARFLASPQTVR